MSRWWLGRRHGTGLTGRDLAGYALAQSFGAIAGSVLANAMFDLTAVTMSTKVRSGGHLWLGEVVATTGLLLLIFDLVRSGRAAVAPAAVGACIGAAYWFTSSTSFAITAAGTGCAAALDAERFIASFIQPTATHTVAIGASS